MTIVRAKTYSWLAGRQPEVGSVAESQRSVPALVKGWLDAGPSVFTGTDRDALTELCRQIDVRKKVSEAYGPGWKALEDERPVDKAVISGLVAVLLANAGAVGADPSSDGSMNDGWGLKCVNSALKALDLDAAKGAPRAPALRAWAMEILDRVHGVAAAS